MYAATVDSQRLNFQASGSLWQDALVMQDIETKSLWAQVYGRAIDGSLTGKELTLFPSTMSTFGEFKKRYKNGTVLKKPPKDKRGSPYQGYFADSSKLGVFGREDDFTRLPAKAKVFGFRIGDLKVAVSYEKLKGDGLVLLEQFDPPIVVLYDKKSETSNAYSLSGLNKAETRSLTLEGLSLNLPDSAASWSATTGKLIASHGGKYQHLDPVPTLSSFWFAWATFFPKTELVR